MRCAAIRSSWPEPASVTSPGRTVSPRGSKRHPVSPADAHAYLGKVSAWLQAAERSEAVDLLTQAGADGRQAARQLAQLLRYETPAQYDPAPMPERDATKAVELARRLVERAAQVNARHRPPSWSIAHVRARYAHAANECRPTPPPKGAPTSTFPRARERNRTADLRITRGSRAFRPSRDGLSYAELHACDYGERWVTVGVRGCVGDSKTRV